MWFRRRRRPEPPPLLPALDRLAELVERVVALLDGARAGELVSKHHKLSPAVPAGASQRPVEVAADELVSNQHKLSSLGDVEGWVAFVPSPAGYRLAERDGAPPARGEAVELDGAAFRVLRLGPSPLPGDRRRCAFLEREERPEGERTSDR